VRSNSVDLVVFGGLGVDVVVRVAALPMPAVDSVTVPVDVRVGNTGAGVALAARAVGLRVLVVDTVGEDALGGVVRAALDRAGIETVLRPDPRGTRRSVNLVDPAGRRMSLYDPRGGWEGPPPLSANEVVDLAARAGRVHVSIMDWLVELLPALVEAGRPISTDLHDWDGRSDYHRPFAAVADTVFVSGVRLPDVDAALAAILGQGRATLATVTLGERGVRVRAAGSGPLDVPAATPLGAVVDSNGAGDAFVAGFLAGQLQGWSTHEAARYAATVAAAACTHHGMEYPPDLLPRP
jgi:sugar/nucleoside kinase (ribokinase family)